MLLKHQVIYTTCHLVTGGAKDPADSERLHHNPNPIVAKISVQFVT